MSKREKAQKIPHKTQPTKKCKIPNKTIKQINSISVAIIDKPLFFRYKKLVFVQYFVICFSISFIG